MVEYGVNRGKILVKYGVNRGHGGIRRKKRAILVEYGVNRGQILVEYRINRGQSWWNTGKFRWNTE